MTSIYTYTDPDFEFDATTGTITGVATFQYDTTSVRRDPDCGDLEDYQEVCDFELVNVAVGGLNLTRSHLEQADRSELELIEKQTREAVQEDWDAGEMDDTGEMDDAA